MCQKPPLFAGHNWLQDHIRKNSSAMRAEIDGMADEEVLAVNIPERARELAEKYRMRSVTLGDPVIADHGQKRLEARGVVSFAVYAIPFEGDPELFRRRVNWMNKMPPVGELWEAERELRVEVNSLVGGTKEMKAAFERTKKDIEEHVKAVTEQVESHNRWLADGARDQMLARRTKVRNHVKLVEELGMPIRPAARAAATVPVTLQRKGSPAGPAASAPAIAAAGGKPAGQPEPTLAMDVYEHILEVIQAAGMSMERGPHSFERMNEGQLRDQMLMVLNSHYQGKATAETFNKKGHTDILVRHEGRNLFVGECKIWLNSGDARQAIEQLLSYTTWRDTKTAALFFTRKRNVSTIMARVAEVFREHQNFLSQDMEYRREGAMRFVMRHGSDTEGRMIVTVMVFQVVGKEKKEEEVVEEERFWD